MFSFIQDFSTYCEQKETHPDLPIFAALYDSQMNLLSFQENKKERHQISFYHAEILLIQEVSQLRQNWRLNDCILVTSLYPCDLCLEAIEEARIEKVYFLAYRQKRPLKKYSFQIMGGFFHEKEEQKLLSFFKRIRESCPSGLRSTLGKRV